MRLEISLGMDMCGCVRLDGWFVGNNGIRWKMGRGDVGFEDGCLGVWVSGMEGRKYI